MANQLGDKKKAPVEELYVELPDDYGPESDAEHIPLCQHVHETVTAYDYKTLEEGEFLNDSIVNFYLSYLHGKLSGPLQDSIHIFSSYFYSKLKGHKSKEKKNDKELKMTKAEKSYLRVKCMTRKVDIFKKQMLVIPICEDLHWYLVIVCNPGMVLSTKHTKHYKQKREEQQKLEFVGQNPFIMVLDSMDATHSSAVSKIRSYLRFEHLERNGFPLDFGSLAMSLKYPPIPLQKNSSDCGIYLLHYAALIFQDPKKFLKVQLPDLTKWFSLSEINGKRRKIAGEIKNMAKAQGTSLELFPKIKFPRPFERTDSSEGEASPSTLPESEEPDPKTRNFNKRSPTGNGTESSIDGVSTQDQKISSEETQRNKRFRLAGYTGNLEKADEQMANLMSFISPSNK